jgi:hypothetical protein
MFYSPNHPVIRESREYKMQFKIATTLSRNTMYFSGLQAESL